MKNIFVTNSFEETRRLGEKIIKNLKNRKTIALYGDLGTGKTTFVQGLARGLGIKKRIISPTFIIIRIYKLKAPSFAKAASFAEVATKAESAGKQNAEFFYHTDLYRINSDKEIEGLGLNEILNDKDSIVAIEWAEKIGKLLPRNRIDVKFEYVSENKRKILIIHPEFVSGSNSSGNEMPK